MKKLISLVFLNVLLINVYADHSFVPDRNWGENPYNPDDLIGDKRYINMIGGIYEKNGIEGVVYFIDGNTGYMKVAGTCSHAADYRTYVTYQEAVEIYRKSKFNMMSLNEVMIYRTNRSIVKYNRTWKVDETHNIITSECIWTTTVGKNGGCMVNDYFSNHTFEVAIDKGYTARHWGTMDVPFEPQYISQYVGCGK